MGTGTMDVILHSYFIGHLVASVVLGDPRGRAHWLLLALYCSSVVTILDTEFVRPCVSLLSRVSPRLSGLPTVSAPVPQGPQEAPSGARELPTYRAILACRASTATLA